MAKVAPLKFTAKLVCIHTLLDLSGDGDREAARNLLRQLETGCYGAVSCGLLRRLVDKYPKKVTNSVLTALASTHLRELKLKNCKSVSFTGLKNVLEKCLLVTMLDLSECDQFSQPEVFHITSFLRPGITALSLENCTTVDNCVVQSILQYMKSLRHLNLSSCSKLTDKVFLLNENLQLRRETCGQVNHDRYECSLVSVDISCTALTSTAIRHLATLTGPTLKHVNISFTGADTLALLYLSGYGIPSVVDMALADTDHIVEESLKLSLLELKNTLRELRSHLLAKDRHTKLHCADDYEPKQEAANCSKNVDKTEVEDTDDTAKIKDNSSPVVAVGKDLHFSSKSLETSFIGNYGAESQTSVGEGSSKEKSGVYEVYHKSKRDFENENVHILDDICDEDLTSDVTVDVNDGSYSWTLDSDSQNKNADRALFTPAAGKNSVFIKSSHSRSSSCEICSKLKSGIVRNHSTKPFVENSVDISDILSQGKIGEQDFSTDNNNRKENSSESSDSVVSEDLCTKCSKSDHLCSQTCENKQGSQTDTVLPFHAVSGCEQLPKTGQQNCDHVSDSASNALSVIGERSESQSYKRLQNGTFPNSEMTLSVTSADRSTVNCNKQNLSGNDSSCSAIISNSEDGNISLEPGAFFNLTGSDNHLNNNSFPVSHTEEPQLDRKCVDGEQTTQGDAEVLDSKETIQKCESLVDSEESKTSKDTDHSYLDESGELCYVEKSQDTSYAYPDKTLQNSENGEIENYTEPKVLVQLYTPDLISIELKKVEFENAYRFDGMKCLKIFSTENKNLQTVKFSWKESFRSGMLEELAPLWPNMSYLSLIDCESVTSQALLTLGMKCKQIQTLTLHGVTFIQDYAIVPFIKNNNLESLKLAECRITDQTLTSIANHKMEKMKDLDLSWCDDTTEIGLNYLCGKTSESMRKLSMRQLAVTDATLSLIASNFQQLTSLNLSSVNGIGDDAIVNLVESIRNLVDIDFSWNLGVSNRSISALLYNCQRLQRAVLAGLKTITSEPFLPLISDLKRWRRCQALLRLKLGERTAAFVQNGGGSSSDEEYNDIFMPHRSTVYATDLTFLNLEFCDQVNDNHLAEISVVCRQESLTIYNYYGELVKPELVVGKQWYSNYVPATDD